MKGELKHKKKQKFTLDKFADIGIFKDSRPDIADIWSEQRTMRSNQVKIDKRQQEKRKQQFKMLPITIVKTTARYKKIVVYCIISLFLVLIARSVIVSKKDNKATLGVVSGDQQNAQNDDGSTDEKPDFEALSPLGKNNLQTVTRRTPAGTLILTFADRLEDVGIEVTQQKLPENFTSAPAAELQKIASNFQATNVIQIDDAVVYHGVNEKSGVQSLFTIRKGVLISIRSSQKVSDDAWAAYLISLN